ncbi:hypothetical protein OPV22_031603 [Ensete ventricosum]|uniref:Aminotransferase-like plant mobile domain-containing protein n=1 Tax=Ensete ventricosum TaxID=4639 RepID=A0AAV8PT65_ENSVE|nr:hypothetical protein OPV22_031603 [Ensete ventricosum]
MLMFFPVNPVSTKSGGRSGNTMTECSIVSLFQLWLYDFLGRDRYMGAVAFMINLEPRNLRVDTVRRTACLWTWHSSSIVKSFDGLRTASSGVNPAAAADGNSMLMDGRSDHPKPPPTGSQQSPSHCSTKPNR